MRIDKVDESIATRRFTIRGEAEKEVVVSVGRPQPDEDSIGYYCPFQISGIGEGRVKYAKGLDAIQALQGAMLLIGADLQFLNERLENKLIWEGDDEGGLGFSS